jgi:hypothetical protein
MGPHKQKDNKRESDTGGCKNHRLSPTATGQRSIGEVAADPRQKRGRNFGVSCRAQALVHRRKERLFLSKRGAARNAASEMRAQFALWLNAGSGGSD